MSVTVVCHSNKYVHKLAKRKDLPGSVGLKEHGAVVIILLFKKLAVRNPAHGEPLEDNLLQTLAQDQIMNLTVPPNLDTFPRSARSSTYY